uniref:Uncharacterized protein n=1 Tax=Siphoviridae sp. ctYh54 TaxID=2826379 RepID=A0A8S5ME39_9CAUD|nr:MAG TPA: hypothetical protein [Siphoviridae sp. ctYh54]
MKDFLFVYQYSLMLYSYDILLRWKRHKSVFFSFAKFILVLQSEH